MYASPSISSGVVRASLAAGPIMSALLGVWALTQGGGVTPSGVAGFAIVVILSLPIGFMISLVPNLLGAAILMRLGCGNDAVRLPVVWATIGALAGSGLAALTDIRGEAALALAAVAAACALICRSGVSWE